jgi:uncharacterized protein (TIGR02453 family)
MMNFKQLFSFLNDLALNNNRDWFNEQKEHYLVLKNDFEVFTNKLIPKISEIDSSIGAITAKDSIFRIYRDVRFSANKDPYKTHFGTYISNGGRKSKMAGYYLHLQPGGSFIAAGAFQPLPNILNEIRYEIFDNVDEFRKIIDNKAFKKYFSGLNGDKGKIVPKGFPKDFDQIELIKYKSYEIIHVLNDNIFLSDKLESYILDVIKAALPFNQFINRAIQNILEE